MQSTSPPFESNKRGLFKHMALTVNMFLHGGKHFPEVMAKGQHIPNSQRDHETYPEKSSYFFRQVSNAQ